MDTIQLSIAQSSVSNFVRTKVICRKIKMPYTICSAVKHVNRLSRVLTFKIKTELLCRQETPHHTDSNKANTQGCLTQSKIQIKRDRCLISNRFKMMKHYWIYLSKGSYLATAPPKFI